MATTKTEADGEEAYAGDTLFSDALGNHPKTKILDVLLTNGRFDMNKTDIARLAGIDRSTVYGHIDDLLDLGLVTESRTIGQTTMYTVDWDDPAAKHLKQFQTELLEKLE